jgi:hypothetical protein
LVASFWQASSAGPRRRYYQLTPAGHAALAERRAEWRKLTEAVASFGPADELRRELARVPRRRVVATAGGGHLALLKLLVGRPRATSRVTTTQKVGQKPTFLQQTALAPEKGTRPRFSWWASLAPAQPCARLVRLPMSGEALR